MQLKRLQQEKDVLQRKVTRLTASISAGGGGGASSGADEQVDYYRRMVKCTLCQENEKNAVIVKCGHTFCRDCIDDRLANRNRKCPACSQQARVPCARRHAHADAHTMHGPCTRCPPWTPRAHTASTTAPCEVVTSRMHLPFAVRLPGSQGDLPDQLTPRG